jgi:hypothetical protein
MDRRTAMSLATVCVVCVIAAALLVAAVYFVVAQGGGGTESAIVGAVCRAQRYSVGIMDA